MIDREEIAKICVCYTDEHHIYIGETIADQILSLIVADDQTVELLIKGELEVAHQKQREAIDDKKNPHRHHNAQYWLGYEHALNFIKSHLKDDRR